MLPRRLQPRILQPQYVVRVLLLRLLLFGLAAYNFDVSLDALVDQRDGPHISWGWRVRLGLLGHVLPLALNAAVLIQAIRDMPSFEAQYKAQHRAVLAATVLGRLMELVSRITSSTGGAQHAMLLHATLFVVHQDPEHLLCLAAMTAAYSAAHMWCQPGLLLQQPVAAVAAGAAAVAAESSSAMPGYKSVGGAILGLTTGGEYFVNVFFVALAIQRVYCHCMGPPEPPGKRQLVLGPCAVSNGRRSRALAPDCTKESSSGGEHGDISSGGNISVGNGLQRTYLLKLALVKASNAFFVALYALQTAQQHIWPLLVAVGILDGPELGSDTSSDASWSTLFAAGALTPAIAGLACAFMLLCHAMCGFVFPAWFKRHATLVNSMSLYTCVCARLYLMLFHTQKQSSGGDKCQGLWECVGVVPEHAFHSFLVLASSLAVHEDPTAWFGAQLFGMATLYRSVHLQLIAAQQHVRTGAGGVSGLAGLLQLPEYWVVAATAVACYRWWCVGRDIPAPAAGRQLHKQHASRWQGQGSTRNSIDEQPTASSSSAAPSRQGSTSDGDSLAHASPPGHQGLLRTNSISRGRCSEGGVADLSASGELHRLQRMACGATCGVLSLGAILTVSPRVLAAALQPTEGMDLLARVLGGTGAAVYMVLQLCFVYLTVFKPSYVLSKRELLWSINFGAPCVQRVLQTMMQVPCKWPPRLNMLILASGMGGMEVPGPWFAAWLPVVSIALFSVHAWTTWQDAAMSSLAIEVMEFNLLPIIIYMATRWATTLLLRLVVSGVLQLARLQGAQTVTNRHKYCVATSTAVLHVMLLSVFVNILQGSLHVLAGLDPFQLLDVGKLALLGMLQRMNILSVTRMEGMSTLLGLLGLGASFLVVSSLQALILSNPAFTNPRQAWYEAGKGKVAGLGERTLRRLAEQEEVGGGAEEEALVIADLRSIAGECLPGCTLLLTLFEEPSLDSNAARQYLVQAGPGAADLSTEESLLLSEMPSVISACEQSRPLYRSGLQPAALGYPDLQKFATTCGLDTFLVVPLAYATQDIGAILVATRAPISLDWHSRQLAGHLGAALSQSLYTLSCVQQMRAGDQIIHDVLPQKVAEHLKRRMIHDKMRSSNTPSESPRAASAPNSHQHPLLSKLSEAASALKAQQQLLQKHQGSAAESLSALHSPGQAANAYTVPVAYQQWHPQVTVLFADISSYTSLSTQVEPEQVMLMLHELFSKYDHLCTRFGIYKVETIGDCYMACTGVLVEDEEHALHMVQFAKAMLGASASVRNPLGGSVHIRVGVHSGRVMSGIVGSIRARYCLFGDTVNTASRMESTGVVDRIQVSEDTYCLLGDLQQDFELREAMSVKGKGVMQTYMLKEEVTVQVAADSAAALCMSTHL